MHVLRGDLSPHRRVLGVGSHQMNVRVRRIPALGRQVGIPLESNLESAGLAGLDLERCPVGPVLGPVSHDQVVGPCRQPRRVAAIHVERQPILRRPPCAGMHPEQPHLVGKPAHCQCFPGRERRPARGVVEAHARGGGEAGRGVRDPQLYVTGIGRDLRGVAPRQRHLAEGDPTPSADDQVRAGDAVARKAGSVEGQRDARQRFARRRLHVPRPPESLSAVPVPCHGERAA